jgi:eukaryotic-like serine/threonine-protein kinase
MRQHPIGRRQIADCWLKKSSISSQFILKSRCMPGWCAVVIDFGPFRFDEPRRTLWCDGQSVPLTGKAFELLSLLLRSRERVVTKEEIFRELWPSTIVEEANLTQTVFLARKALGETARNARYILTVPGIGYRFGQSASPSEPSVSDPGIVGAPSRVTKNRTLTAVVATIIVTALLVGLTWIVGRPPASVTARSIVITELRNSTGEPVFDRTLRRALTIQLAQSPAFKLLSDERIATTLQLMGRPAGTALTRRDAGDLCKRNGGDAVLDGSLERIGDRYVLMLEASACESGELLASVQSLAEDAEGVLDALNDAGNELRAKLGESHYSLRQFSKPLREATTGSLPALQVFSAAADRMRYGPDPSSALPMLKKAIEIDPNFALAHAYLAYLYANLSELEQAAVHSRSAYALRDRVSERERLLLTSNYHSLVSGDVDEEMAIYQVWTARYPLDWLPLAQLADVYATLGRYPESLQLSERALRLEPRQPYAPTTMALALQAMNRPSEARAVLERALQQQQDGSILRSALYEAAVLQEDEALQAASVQWSKAQRPEDGILAWIAAGKVQRGQLAEARSMIDHHTKELCDAGFSEQAAVDLISLSLAQAHFGDASNARTTVRRAMQLTHANDLLAQAAVVYALIDDVEQAQKLLSELDQYRLHPAPTVHVLKGVARAFTAMSEGEHTTAVKLLEPLRRYDFGSSVGFSTVYARGLGYLGAGHAELAATEFRTIVDRRGISPLARDWPMAHLGLARALAAQGDHTSALVHYERLLEFWSGADADLAVVREAREEAERLRAR